MKLASGTHTDWILNKDKKIRKNIASKKATYPNRTISKLIEKPTNVTDKFIDQNEKENRTAPKYIFTKQPKRLRPSRINTIIPFTGLNMVEKSTENFKQRQTQNLNYSTLQSKNFQN